MSSHDIVGAGNPVPPQSQEAEAGNGQLALVTAAGAGQTPAAVRGKGIRQSIRVFVSNPLGVIGIATIAVMLLFSFVGPYFYRTDQLHPHLLQITQRPGGRFPLGTDNVGYDVLGRLMVAGQSSLEVGLAAAVIAGVLGTFWGAMAGYVGGWVDSVMMRFVDALIALPSLLLVLLLATIARPSITVVILVLGTISWLATARLVRGEVLVLKSLDFVKAAENFGESPRQIVVRHMVRNVIGIVVVQVTFEVANAILLFAALSFLGLGLPPPAANWGGMLTDGLNYAYDGYWWLIYPAGLCIVVTVVAFNLAGDALRDVFEVRRRGRGV